MVRKGNMDSCGREAIPGRALESYVNRAPFTSMRQALVAGEAKGLPDVLPSLAYHKNGIPMFETRFILISS